MFGFFIRDEQPKLSVLLKNGKNLKHIDEITFKITKIDMNDG